MQLEYLRSFLEVYRTGSMTKAAQNIGMTQPAISAHIKALEAKIEKPLFLRVNRGLTPTPIADELATTINNPLEALEDSWTNLKPRSQNIEGTIYISGPGEFIQCIASKTLAHVIPLGIRLRLRTGNRDTVIQHLESGEAELAFINKPFDTKRFSHEIIKQEKLIPVASPEWTGRYFNKCRNANELINMDLIAYDSDLSLVRQYFNETINETCTKPPVAIVHDLRIIKELLYQSVGYSVLPDYLCEEDIRTGKLVKLIENVSEPINQIHLTWPKIKLRDPRVAFVKNYLIDKL